MGVYNAVNYDGRAIRSAESLSNTFDVVVISLDSGLAYNNESFRLITIRSTFICRKGILLLLWFWLRFLLQALVCRPDIVYGHNYYMTLPSMLAAYITKSKFVYDAYELIIPERRIRSSIRTWFFYLLERISLKRASLVITANVERARIMKAHYKLRAHPTAIYNISEHPSINESAKHMVLKNT